MVLWDQVVEEVEGKPVGPGTTAVERSVEMEGCSSKALSVTKEVLAYSSWSAVVVGSKCARIWQGDVESVVSPCGPGPDTGVQKHHRQEHVHGEECATVSGLAASRGCPARTAR